jgi:hypothetical protein
MTMLAALVPAAAAATQPDPHAVNNPRLRCTDPLPSSVVVGELGSTLWISDLAQIDRVTFSAAADVEVLRVDWAADDHEVTIDLSGEATAYIAWSCAPVNGEPQQANDPQEV